MAGIAAYVKALKPHIQIIGVEPTGANAMAQSLALGQRVTLSKVDAFAGGWVGCLPAVEEVLATRGDTGRTECTAAASVYIVLLIPALAHLSAPP